MTVSSTDAAPENGAEADVNAGPAAESSTAAETGAEKTLLGAVKAALAGPEESPTSTSGDEDSPPETAESDDGKSSVAPPEESGDLTEEDMKRLSAKTQSRIHQLVAERKTALTEITDLRPKAERLDAVLSYMEKHQIAPAEFDNTLEITRLIKTGNFGKALEVLTPIYQELQKRTGDILPADLEERVRLGYITKVDAQELHRRRVEAGTAEQRQRAEAERTAAVKADEEWKAQVNSAADVMTQWERAKEAKDPDWKLKQDFVAAEVKILAREEGFPTKKEEVVALGEKALRTVEARLKQFAPRPQERRTPTTQPVSPRTEAKPASFLDAVKQGLARAHAG